ncbi:MAG: hypothetical protein Q9168_006658 [Polycauliona sp. 1 TL-2023]
MARLELRERRVEMRQQHGLIRSLETRLLKKWRMFNNSTNGDAITELHAELCIALDKLGPIEVDYDEREDGLDTLEYDLEEKEAGFYEQNSSVEPLENDGRLLTQHSSTLTLSDEFKQDLLSPQYQYYSRIGDAQIARERLMDLASQKDLYLNIEREREALGIPLYQDNIDFLSQYDDFHAEHQKDLENIERDIQSLGIQAAAPLINVEAPSGRVTFQELGWDLEANTGDRHSSPVSEPGHPGRSSPSPSSDEYPRRKSENDMWDLPIDTGSSRDRINHWILERLKDSRFERALHKAELDSPNLDYEAWCSLVRQFWQLDRAARSSQNSSRHASAGASISAKAQELRGSTDLDLAKASIALQIETQAPSVPHELLPVNEYTEEDMEQLGYLDLAARPMAKSRKTPEEEGFGSGKLTASVQYSPHV